MSSKSNRKNEFCIFEELKLDAISPEAKEAFRRLTSRDPDEAWTSGQWMTEKRGGSDVGSGTDTHAIHVDGNRVKNNNNKN